MFQIGFGLGSDSSKPGRIISFNDIIRNLLSSLDFVVYTLIKYAYVIFFNVATAEIVNSEMITKFYKRIQLILGVIMIFKLSMSLIQIIINPEMMSDQKQGLGKVVSRIVVMLGMIVAIMPLSIPNAKENSYNDFLNKHGLLFGTMYSLQYRILDQNTIAKLVLGYTSTTTTKNQEKKGEALASYILMTFIRPNDKCDKDYDEYKNWDDGTGYTIDSLVNDINKECGSKKIYKYAYFPIVSTICGLLILMCLVLFCVDIAIRAIKLAILRLIAPIPIISYIDPKSSENGTFANWVKILISTYLDVFLRLAIIYLVIAIVQQIMIGNLDLPLSDGSVAGLLATVFIIVGLFIFAQQAPKFIKDALGLKGNMSNFGLGGFLAGVGALATRGNIYDAYEAARTATNAQIQAYNQGKGAPPLFSNFTSGRDMMAQNLTGNPKMTYDQMRRGRNFLAFEGITDDMAEKKKNEMFALEDEAEMLKNINDKINMNGYDSLSNSEKLFLEKEYRNNNKIGTDPLTANQYEAMKQSAMDAYLKKKSAAGKASAEYKAIQKEQEAHGATLGYREKYQSRRTNARWSDVGVADDNGYVPVSRGYAATHLGGLTRNSVNTVVNNVRERHAGNVRQRSTRTSVENDAIQRARAAEAARRNQP